MKKLNLFLCILLVIFPYLEASAESFKIPESPYDSVVGELIKVRIKKKETLLDTAREYELGYEQIIKANPNLNRWVPKPNASVLIPSKYIIPNEAKEGIILNLSERRLYYFPSLKQKGESSLTPIVITFPISIGRDVYATPIGLTKVVDKVRNPAWRPTASIKAEYASQGTEVPDVIPSGHPDNPLGKFALKLGFSQYLIHGTSQAKSFGIGMKVSHGCIRMYPENIEWLYKRVPKGTKVRIIENPLKVGTKNGKLYLEVHSALESETAIKKITVEQALRMLNSDLSRSVVIDKAAVIKTVRMANGIPTLVGQASNLLPPAREPN